METTLMNHIPAFWANSPEVVAFEGALQVLTDDLLADWDDLTAQTDINTATTLLPAWASYCGVPDNAGESYENRRKAILAAPCWQGPQVCTKALLLQVLNAYSEDAAEVTAEDAATRTISVTLHTLSGANSSKNLAAAEEAAAKVLPADVALTLTDVKIASWGTRSSGAWSGLSTCTWAEAHYV